MPPHVSCVPTTGGASLSRSFPRLRCRGLRVDLAAKSVSAAPRSLAARSVSQRSNPPTAFASRGGAPCWPSVMGDHRRRKCPLLPRGAGRCCSPRSAGIRRELHAVGLWIKPSAVQAPWGTTSTVLTSRKSASACWRSMPKICPCHAAACASGAAEHQSSYPRLRSGLRR